MYVAADLKEISILVYKNRLVSPTKQGSIGLGVPVVSLCVHTIEVAHCPAEIRARRTQQQVIVVAHQTVSVALHAKDVAYLAEQIEKQSAVQVAWKDDAATGATVHHVVPGALELDAQGA